MNLTLEELNLMIEEMKKNNATQLNLDINIDYWGGEVENIDFDIWKNGKFVKTVLTI